MSVVGKKKVGKSLTFTASIGVPLAPVASVSWLVDGQPAGDGTVLSTSFSSAGSHRVTVVATDLYGFQGTSSVDLAITIPKR